MANDRLEELMRKASGPGLSDDEAAELGQLLAEREGKPYAQHDDPPVSGVREERRRRRRAASSTYYGHEPLIWPPKGTSRERDLEPYD